VIFALPAVARSLAGMMATSWPELMKAVARGVAFHSTVELDAKPEPFMVTSRSLDPAGAEDGVIEPKLGTGLLGPVTGNETAGEPITRPGVLTETLAVIAWEMSD